MVAFEKRNLFIFNYSHLEKNIDKPLIKSYCSLILNDKDTGLIYNAARERGIYPDFNISMEWP